ncbi:MAG: hypothetical protein OXK72_05020 [Gammaproteobacteria bacterium]|nr:hypothetical protein [Gammaproteobacteria bacterium]
MVPIFAGFSPDWKHLPSYRLKHRVVMATGHTKRRAGIWDHANQDERGQPILFKHQVKSQKRRTWDFVWQTLTLAVIAIFCLIGGTLWFIVGLLAVTVE